MIPRKLTLHNFMCYRDPQPLDFTGMDLACLSGSNGHGKSSLLDAMTWALWGRARSNQADELIFLGQTEMWVDFEFALGPQRYRVIRSRERKGRSGKSDLQLQVWQPDNTWRAITEPTVRATEDAIIALLRMDYETFISSAFLMQNRADAFTVKPPNERKQVLADILGLRLYDDYENRAKERARQEKQEAMRLGGQLEAIQAELARQSDYQAEWERAQAEAAHSSEQLRAADQTLQTLRAERQDLLAQRRTLDDLRTRMQRAEKELAASQEQRQNDQRWLAADQALLAQREEIEAGHARWQAARQVDQALNRQLSQHVAWQAQATQAASQIAQARVELEAEQRGLGGRYERLRTHAGQLAELQRQLAATRAERARLDALAAKQADLRQQVQALKEQSAALQAHNQTLREEMQELQDKLDVLRGAGAACPVCAQPLGPEELNRVLEDYSARGRERGDQFRANQTRLAEVHEHGRRSEAELAEIEQTLRAQARLLHAEGQTEQRLHLAEQAQTELAEVEQQQAHTASRLAAVDYAPQAQAALRQLEGQLAALGYDAAAHAEAREQVASLELYDTRRGELQQAAARADTLRGRIELAEALCTRLAETLAADTQRRDELAAAQARLPDVERTLAAQTAAVERLERSANDARQRMGAARQRLDACQALASRRESLTAELKQTQERQATFEELQAAFGKKGLQAMIIEAAIPEIESEANQLLHRMTDGRMSVRLETQKETKTTQELRETLDIILSDELGGRDYSLFSGGEAFRANLAIRIALSKLLARRAGAALQTLIIDEGFGTQDTQGRERLVQAITSIQHDFALILVITHIEELKDLFPTRIEVEKTAAGSQILIT